jgi:hypothetical protein
MFDKVHTNISYIFLYREIQTLVPTTLSESTLGEDNTRVHYFSILGLKKKYAKLRLCAEGCGTFSVKTSSYTRSTVCWNGRLTNIRPNYKSEVISVLH